MKVPDLNITGGACRESSIKKHYPEFYKLLIETYPKDISFAEKLYWYRAGINTYPLCPICGKKLKLTNSNVGYQRYCSSKCSNSADDKKQKTAVTNIKRYGGVAPACDDKIKTKMKSTNLERYGVENISQSKEHYEKNIQTRVKKYGGCGNASKTSKEKYTQTCIERYGCDNPMHSKQIQERLADSNIKKYGVKSPFSLSSVRQKIYDTCLRRYGIPHFNNIDQISKTMSDKYGYSFNFQNPGVLEKSSKTRIDLYGDPHYNNAEKYKATMQDRYGVDCAINIPGVLQKIYASKKKNHTFNTSNIEKSFEKYLESKNIKFQTQYKSDLYPFSCDFYIEELDLYIEIQASWTHGEHPYDPEVDESVLKIWGEKSKKSKFYANAIDVWTIRDVKKRQIAKQNNLRYLEIFTNDINKAIDEYERFVSAL